MADFADKTLTRTPDFQQAAQPGAAIIEAPKVMVSLQLDADLLAHFQSENEPGDWQRHMNDVLRFYVETSQMAEANAEFDDAMFQQQDGPKP
jgi:uncharacterized protein (DUF4415 family)